jgi:sulfate adenylyltransferase
MSSSSPAEWSAHGGPLVDLVTTSSRAAELRAASRDFASWDLTPRQTCDLELLATGAFAPLRGFMVRSDYEGVCAEGRLRDGTLWPIPVVLDVSEAFAGRVSPGQAIALRDAEGVMLAVLHIEDIHAPDRRAEANSVYGTDDTDHPGVAYLFDRTGPLQIGGRVEVLQLPTHHDFSALRHTPAQIRNAFAERGWQRVVAFQTRNPMHRAHQELTIRAARDADARLLIHPVVGVTKPGDVDHYTRVRCYQALLPAYAPNSAMLSLLPLAMRMAGPREAVWHAIIRRNFGVTHFIVGRDHAGPGADRNGRPFYGPYDAQQALARHEREIGVTMVPFRQMVYVPAQDRYMAEDDLSPGTAVESISGTEQRQRLQRGERLPTWFTFPAVERELRRSTRSRAEQGFTVFFTGLSGAGKSTIANVLLSRLLERGGRRVTLLDGDHIRKFLSSELGFSAEHRDLNIRRIGYVASEVTKAGGIAICAPIAPYDAVRREVRQMVSAHGGFVLVHAATPLEICEQRDRKGLYAKARAGLVQEFTGVSAPYETPRDADVTIDTQIEMPEEAAHRIIAHLECEGYLTDSFDRSFA